MNERTVLEQRITTLDDLVAAGGVLGPAGASLGQRLRSGWEVERRLLGRIVAETPGDDVRATLALWQARTEAFVAKSDAEAPGWTDKEGNHWDAREVLALLDDTVERLDAWLAADEPFTAGDDEDDGGAG
jgi:hypothetical protein